MHKAMGSIPNAAKQKQTKWTNGFIYLFIFAFMHRRAIGL
jgi:hypothetical protein